MAQPDTRGLVRLDLNNPVFQENLLSMEKTQRHSALETLNKLRQMTWSQVCRYIAIRAKMGEDRQRHTSARDHGGLLSAHFTIQASDSL